MITIQQNLIDEECRKHSEIRHLKTILFQMCQIFWLFFFNKCQFLSLFSQRDVFTFVSSIENDSPHQPMTQIKVHIPLSCQMLFKWSRLLLTLATVLLCATSYGQGWEKYFGSNFDEEGHSIIQTRNGDYIIAGFTQGFGAGNTAIYAVRTDVDGRKIWERAYDEGFITRGYSIIETDDNAYLIVGEIINVPQIIEKNVFLIKINDRGDVLWKKQYGGPENDSGQDIIRSEQDGGFLIVGKTASSGNGGDDIYLIKIDANGTQQWSKTYGTSENDAGLGAVETADGYLITGSAFNTNNGSSDIYLMKIDFSGNEIWGNQFFGTTEFDEGHSIVATSDGNFAIAGQYDQDAFLLKVSPVGNETWLKTYGGSFGAEAFDVISTFNGDLVFTGVIEITEQNNDAFLVRYDIDGNEVWNKIIGRSFSFDWSNSLIQTADKGFATAGYNALDIGLIFFNDITFLKANADGDVYTNTLSGKVFIDDNEDCTFNDEVGLNEWIVTAKSATNTFFGTSDTDGNYEIILDTGIYAVTIFTKNPYWESCVTGYNVTYSSQYDTLTRNFPILRNTLCPLLEVDVSAPIAQHCENIGYSVDYCNYGTVGVADPMIEIILDEDLTMIGASIPFTQIGDSLYVFDLDSLGIDECGLFTFSTTSSCNGEPFEAYMVSAHIFPDTICVPTTGWDFSDIKVDGFCDSDSIRFEILNDGDGDMEAPLNFIVIEDHILALAGEFFLTATEDTTITIEKTDSTYRIIAQQSPGHPGNSYPTVTIEGCNNGGSFSTGFVTEHQEDENDPFVSVDVQEAISPSDYIFMQGYPKGYLENGDRLVPANTPLQYHIYFQNQGTDTIQRLVIRDTLPPNLELTSVVPGASSHHYQYELYGNGILRFTYDNLKLAPAGDTGSIGFVQFKVSQKPDNPDGTIIPNSAAIFLGHDEPRQTATTVHVVGTPEPLLALEIVDFINEPITGIEVKAYPNPFISSIVFEIKENRFTNLTLTVFDMSGRLVCQEKDAGDQIQLTRGNLLAGMYTYRLEADGLLLNTGKIIVR